MSNTLHYNNTIPGNIYYNNAKVQNVYYNNTKVWSSGPPVTGDLVVGNTVTFDNKQWIVVGKIGDQYYLGSTVVYGTSGMSSPITISNKAFWYHDGSDYNNMYYYPNSMLCRANEAFSNTYLSNDAKQYCKDLICETTFGNSGSVSGDPLHWSPSISNKCTPGQSIWLYMNNGCMPYFSNFQNKSYNICKLYNTNTAANYFLYDSDRLPEYTYIVYKDDGTVGTDYNSVAYYRPFICIGDPTDLNYHTIIINNQQVSSDVAYRCSINILGTTYTVEPAGKIYTIKVPNNTVITFNFNKITDEQMWTIHTGNVHNGEHKYYMGNNGYVDYPMSVSYTVKSNIALMHYNHNNYDIDTRLIMY